MNIKELSNRITSTEKNIGVIAADIKSYKTTGRRGSCWTKIDFVILPKLREKLKNIYPGFENHPEDVKQKLTRKYCTGYFKANKAKIEQIVLAQLALQNIDCKAVNPDFFKNNIRYSPQSKTYRMVSKKADKTFEHLFLRTLGTFQYYSYQIDIDLGNEEDAFNVDNRSVFSQKNSLDLKIERLKKNVKYHEEEALKSSQDLQKAIEEQQNLMLENSDHIELFL